MNGYKEILDNISEQHHKILKDKNFADNRRIPGNVFFLDNDDILSMPRNDGDCRYPYGKDGFNFWAYSSGYMHSNEGLFSHFLRAGEGQEPRIAFFAGIFEDGKSHKLVSLLPVPVPDIGEAYGASRYTVFAKACVFYITEVPGIRFSIRVFPDEEKKVHFTLGIENLNRDRKRLFVSSYLNPFLAHSLSENAESRWFRETRYLEPDGKAGLGSFVIRVNEDLSRTVSVSNFGVIKRTVDLGSESILLKHEATTSRYQYVGGSRSSLHTPFSLWKGTFGSERHICAFTEMGIAGDIISIEAAGCGMVRYDMEFSYAVHCRDDKPLKALLKGHISGRAADEQVALLEKNELEQSGRLSCRVSDSLENKIKPDVFNSFFRHLKKQVEFCSLIKGYVQLSAGSLIGIRDIFQAIEGLLFWQPQAARSKMLEAMDFVFTDGRCPRQYTLPHEEGSMPVMDLRPFIDQGVWVISAVVAYIKATGDTAFLDEICGYYEIADEKKSIVQKSGERDTVLEHMYRIMNYLLSNRDFEETGCIRALYGDWNDALDGLGVSIKPGKEYGNGVSMMASLQVYQNLLEMTDLLAQFNSARENACAASYKEALSRLKEGICRYGVIEDAGKSKRIVHGWGDGRAYYVGSFKDPDHVSRHGLTSNAFWVLSGMYDTDKAMKGTVMEAFKALDSQYGYKTFEPYFPAGTPGVGRIPKLPAGTAENGAVYIHASAFAVMALFRMGCPEEAWQQLVKLLPFTHERISCSPFVMPNSYGFNTELLIDGESMHDWQTGSSNVVLKTLIRFVFGVEPDFGGVWIQPAGWCPFKKLTLNMILKACDLTIHYHNSGKGKRRFKINGAECKGTFNDILGIERLWIPDRELTEKLAVDVED